LLTTGGFRIRGGSDESISPDVNSKEHVLFSLFSKMKSRAGYQEEPTHALLHQLSPEQNQLGVKATAITFVFFSNLQIIILWIVEMKIRSQHFKP